jgi:1-deoxy-D-xylulose-5-phosphate synthase
MRKYKYLDEISSPKDLKKLNLNDLNELADELRTDLISSVSKTGGHLGAGLGVVELTIALHYVFDAPQDKIIWDVGHQAYPHKILTGRRIRMDTLRQKDGLSGFTNREESNFDPFGAGHSSTSISAGLGMAVARDLKGESNAVISVIGDGAMSAGMAWEALNNLGDQKRKMIVILNDNDMSIAPAVGAVSSYLSKLISSKPLNSIRELAKQVASHLPSEIEKAAKRADELARNVMGGGTIFSNLGMYYIGPMDGHNIEDLVQILQNLKNYSNEGPVLLHVVTEKGKGHPFGKEVIEKYHAVPKFDVITGEHKKSASKNKTYTQIFSEELIKQATKDEKILAVTAAMPSGTGLDKFSETFPERFFDVGIAEQHAVTFCAGMSSEGFKPYCSIYSTFLQRAYDQIVHDVAIQNLPVKFIIDRAGYVGADGATHQGSFDIAFLSCLPNFVIMAPSGEQELINMIKTSVSYNDGPLAIRYPRGEAKTSKDLTEAKTIKIGKGKTLLKNYTANKKGDIAFLSIGTRLDDTLEAAKKLKSLGYNVSVSDARFAKPIDNEMILELANNNNNLLVIEEASSGGFSSAVISYLANLDLTNSKFRIKTLSMPDYFIDHKSQDEQIAQAGLNTENIFKKALLLLEDSNIEAIS